MVAGVISWPGSQAGAAAGLCQSQSIPGKLGSGHSQGGAGGDQTPAAAAGHPEPETRSLLSKISSGARGWADLRCVGHRGGGGCAIV